MSFDETKLNKVLEALQFGNTYPGFAPVSAAEQTGTAPTSDLQQRVVAALQGVLGRTFKQGDYRSFRVALEASFEYKEIGGRLTYEWKPRAYPLTGGVDIGGGITGAQYSLVSIANLLYEQTLPLIDNLYSLIPDVDKEQLEAARSVLRTTWSEFVGELGREGGPRVLRADTLSKSIYQDVRTVRGVTGFLLAEGHLVRFGRLLGMLRSEVDNKWPKLDPKHVPTINNELRGENDIAPLLGDRPAVARFNVLTTDEEENLTNFIALTDIYITVAQRWKSYSSTFLQQGPGERDLGTGLFSLERLFAVLEESVSEVYIAMDSVNIDQAERLVIPINPANPTGLKIEDLLSWVASFASTEAPQLVRDGGKWGVQAIKETATTLHVETSKFLSILNDPAVTGLTPGFKHTRVKNPVAEMVGYLDAIVKTADEIAG